MAMMVFLNLSLCAVAVGLGLELLGVVDHFLIR
jgi:hypothetical protein